MSPTRSAQASLTRSPAPYIVMYSARYFGEWSAAKIASTSVPLNTTGRRRGDRVRGIVAATSGRPSVTEYRNFNAAP